MPESAEKILQELTDVGLLSPEDVTQYDSVVASGSEALMIRLVEDEVVTQYQADKFLAGLASDIAFGDYLVIRELGQGGMGTVLLAKHRRMDREVAIKILPIVTLGSEDAVARFYQEVKVAAQLKHPNIVHAYDAGDHRGFHYLVMEFVEGHDLARVLQQLGPIPIALANDYITQAAHGLEYAHGKGVVHRDIKPSNLLLDDEGVIKVLDMGLARIGDGAEKSLQLTTTGQVMGTVDYMSPEQAEDTRDADGRSDIYSLGCTLYRLVMGKGPFSRDTVVKTILAHREAPIPDIDVPHDPGAAELNQIFKKMVAKKPDDRYQTISELLNDLGRTDGDGNYFAKQNQPLVIADGPTMAPISSPLVPPSTAPPTNPTANSPLGPIPVPPPSSEQHFIGDSNYAPTPSIPADPPSSPPGIPPLYGPIDAKYAVPMKPHRGRKLLIASIASVLLSFCVVGAIPGIIIWVYANSDSDEMRHNLRDASGFNLTKTAKVFSQIAVGIGGVTALFSPFWFN